MEKQNDISLERVIKGLECCTKYGAMCGLDCSGYYQWDDDSRHIKKAHQYRDFCSYGKCKTGCVVTLAKDALALLKADLQAIQEAQATAETNAYMEEWGAKDD